MSQNPQTRWWGRFNFTADESRAWQLGGLDLAVTRAAHEWRFQTRNRLSDQHEDNQRWSQDDALKLPASAPVSRFFYGKTGEALYLLPRLADRSVVVKPLSPLFIPPGQSVTLFVSTPVWVGCYAENFDAPVLDLPVSRPSDTWFGRDTIRGEVCYATKITGRTELAQLPPRPFRAVTPVTLHNGAGNMMPIERINVPVPVLGVYAGENGMLWTQPLHVQRESGNRPPRIRLEAVMLPEAGAVEMLTPPRLGASEHALARILDNLFD